MSLLEFCLSVTWRYSCLFLLLEFHSWVVSLFFFFKSPNKYSGVLTFIWIKAAFCIKHLWECSVTNVRSPNDDVQVWPPGISILRKRDCVIFFLESIFKGKPRWLTAQKQLENETKPEREGCYTHRSKEFPRVFFFPFLFLQTCRKGEKSWKKRETKGERERCKFYWVRLHLLLLLSQRKHLRLVSVSLWAKCSPRGSGSYTVR